jgi:mannose-6-phosphate isomerase-like protein (cupin superfamily)
MLKAGDIVDNPVTGQRLLICKTEQDTHGAYVEVEYIHQPFAGKNYSPRHWHPTWTERFEILSGSARYRLGPSEQAAGPGKALVFPAGVPHIHPWNAGAAELRVRQTTIPPRPDPQGLRATLTAIETLIGLAQAGKVNRDGLPNPLQLAVLLRSLLPNTHLAGLPIPIQRPLLSLLASLGQAAGYRANYPEERLRATH